MIVPAGADNMTPSPPRALTAEEKQAKMDERNVAICLYYKEGHKLSETASHFKLGRQRVLQILQRGGVWMPYEKSKRDKFLGVQVSEETKAALQKQAESEGTSVSRFVSDKLDEIVAKPATE